jgi:hypothetical protein
MVHKSNRTYFNFYSITGDSILLATPVYFQWRTWIKIQLPGKLLLVNFLFLCFASCQVISHSQRQAAEIAITFSELAIVKHNFQEASNLVIGKNFSEIEDKLRNIITTIHPLGEYPEVI